MSTDAAIVADADDPLVGQELGPFRIGALLGRGGMGAVYAAEHAVLGRRVAIKLLEPHLTVDPDALGRFVEEARAVNSIRHPNIIDITDFGNLEGRPYFVMELLEGETLGARIAQWGHLPLASTLRICAQVASALTAAHDRGIVHRDLKPDNVFICNHPDYPDHVKVLDFGIAKLMRPSGQSGKKLSTQAGMVLGTPLYMSPEQSLGDTIDPRSDVYALGIVLYEALTGTSPFDRPSVAEILIAHVHDMPPSPRTIEPSIPEALEALILRALAKSPSHRFDDMRQMRAALLACTHAPATKRVIQIVPTPTTAAASLLLAAASTAAVPAVMTAKTAPAVIGETLRGIILQRIAANRLVLPTLPKATNSALAALRKPDANLAHIAAMLEEDPLIAPQLLRVASSAVYGGTTVPSVAQAVVRLGVRRLRSLLFELSVRRVFTSPRPSLSAAFRGLWRHSVLVAMLARRICNELGNPVDAEAVHLAGLLHDVGKPLVGAMLLEAEKLIGKSFQIDLDTWIEIVGQSHREVANALAVKWQLVPELRHAIASSDQYHPGVAALTTNIVCFANAIAKHAGQTVGPIDNEAAETLIAEGTELLGIDWRFVHVLRTAIEEFVASDDD